MEGVERYKVRLLPHNPEWEDEFLEVKEEIKKCWGNNVLDIQHVGSTAIKSIYAKPILDIAVRLKSIGQMNIKALTDLGYDYCGAQNENRTWHLFVLRGENQISLRHIHCYAEREPDFDLMVGFRDYLNTHLGTALQYQDLKIRLAEQFTNDRVAYTDAKEQFIKSVCDKLKK